MNCREIDASLHLLVGDPWPGVLQEAARSHVAACARCRRLLAIARGDPSAMESIEPIDLVASIVEKTSGTGGCADDEARLSGWADGSLDGLDVELVREHLSHCSTCSELVGELRALGTELPLMAEVEPDGRFLSEVLDRTSGRANGRSTLAEVLAIRWSRLVYRPRIAQELAYIGAMILMLATGSREGFRTAVDSPAIAPTSAISAGLAEGFAQGSAVVSEIAVRLGDALGSQPPKPLGEHLTTVAAEASRTGSRVARTASLVGHGSRRAADALVRMDTVGLWRAVRDLRDAIRFFWKDAPSTEPSAIPVRTPADTNAPDDRLKHKEGIDEGHDD